MALGFKGGYRFSYSLPKDLTIVKTEIPSKLSISVPKGFVVSVSELDCLNKDTVLATHEDGSVLMAGVMGSVVFISDTRIEIAPRYDQEQDNLPIASKLSEISPSEIVEHMRSSGIMSECGVPMWRMFAPVVECGEMLILNAAECEPGVNCVHAMLRLYPEKILGGLKIMMRALALPKAIVVMTETMHHEAEILRRHLKHKGMLDILGMVEKYPIENSKVLFSAITGFTNAPSLHKSVLVTVLDCIAVYDYFVDGHIPCSRILTVEGNNYEVFLGTPVEDLSSLCNITVNDSCVPHVGGLVSAQTASKDTCVEIDTKSVQYLPKHVFRNYDCIDCGKCSNFCPVGLLPMSIVKCLKSNRVKSLNMDACIECGICTAVCYSEIDICGAIYHYRMTGFDTSGDLQVMNENAREEAVEYTQIGNIEEENYE